nr:hypothetical protein 12newDp_00002 [Serratia proteamaculans]ULG14202.1 hypothetical protein 25Ep1_00102 [Serratia proteamaculans]
MCSCDLLLILIAKTPSLFLNGQIALFFCFVRGRLIGALAGLPFHSGPVSIRCQLSRSLVSAAEQFGKQNAGVASEVVCTDSGSCGKAAGFTTGKLPLEGGNGVLQALTSALSISGSVTRSSQFFFSMYSHLVHVSLSLLLPLSFPGFCCQAGQRIGPFLFGLALLPLSICRVVTDGVTPMGKPPNHNACQHNRRNLIVYFHLCLH